MKRWRITSFSADGRPGVIIECRRFRRPARLARARMWMESDLVRSEIELI